MEELICRNCIHFRQHYVPSGTSFMKAGCGHCVYPRLKHRKPDTFGCAHFRKRESEEKKD